MAGDGSRGRAPGVTLAPPALDRMVQGPTGPRADRQGPDGQPLTIRRRRARQGRQGNRPGYPGPWTLATSPGPPGAAPGPPPASSPGGGPPPTATDLTRAARGRGAAVQGPGPRPRRIHGTGPAQAVPGPGFQRYAPPGKRDPIVTLRSSRRETRDHRNVRAMTPREQRGRAPEEPTDCSCPPIGPVARMVSPMRERRGIRPAARRPRGSLPRPRAGLPRRVADVAGCVASLGTLSG